MAIPQAFIVEDEKILANQLKYLLEASGFEVSIFLSAEEFILSFGMIKTPSFFIIDLGLPGLRGTELVKLIRFKEKLSPIYVISGNPSEKDVTDCLHYGADDFLIKPYNHEHLIMKLKNAHTRMSTLLNEKPHNGIQIIPEGYLVIRNVLKVKLTKREFGILEKLLSDPEHTYTREELITVGGPGDITDRSIDVHISSLRKKIVDLNIGIETSRGQGYKIVFL